MFDVAEDRGYNKINPEDGMNEWINDGVSHGRRTLKMKVSNETAAAELDRLFLDAARRYSKRAGTA